MKKFLSLVLALVMTMSLVTVSAGAKDFTDASSITYEEAVAVMSEVGVIDGYADGDFRPTATLTRGAAAKIICNLILGPTTAGALVADAAPYSDVPTDNVFAGYIAYCQKTGIVGGYADGTFRPAASLTGYAFMKMLLGALGYKAEVEGYTGANWSINVAKQAINAGLNKGLTSDFNGIKAVTREEACLYAFNTLQATMVDYDTTITINGVTVAGARFDVTNAGKETIKNDDKMQFAERYFTKLVASDDTDVFGRPATKWVNNKKEIGTYVDYTELVGEYTTKVTGKDLYDLLGSTAIKNSDVNVYVDGETEQAILGNAFFTSGKLVKTNTNKVGETGNGVLTQVFQDVDNEEITIVIINTYLATVDGDYSEKKDEADLTVYSITDANSSASVEQYVKANNTEGMTVKAEDFGSIVEEMKEDDVVLVTVADGEVQTIALPEVIADTEIDSFKDGSYLTVSGEKYDFGSTLKYDAKLVDYTGVNSAINLKDTTYNVYMDEYGYVIGIDEVSSTTNYLFVTGYDDNYSNLSAKTADVAVIFTDGTMDVVDVKVKDSKKANGTTNFFTSSVTPATMNTWCTYTVDKNGVYTLKEVDAFSGTAAGQYSDTARTTEIDKKHITLKSQASSSYAYGNNDSIYIVVDTDTIKVDASKTAIIIDDVDSVATGVKNVNLVPTAASTDTTTYAGGVSGGVYTLFDKNNYVIAAVVVGENDSASKNYAYVISDDINLESYDKTEDEYTWSRDVIVDGELTTIEYKGDTLAQISTTAMKQGEWYEIKYYADGTVKSASQVNFAASGDKFGDSVQGIDYLVTLFDTVYMHDVATVTKLTCIGATLYTDTTLKNGFPVDEDVKVFLGLKVDGTEFDEVNDYTGVKGLEKAIRDLDADNDNGFTAGTVEISAVIENGVATTVIINDKTGTTTNEGVNTGSGSKSVKAIAWEKGWVNVYSNTEKTTRPGVEVEVTLYQLRDNGYVEVGTYTVPVSGYLDLNAAMTSGYTYKVTCGAYSDIVSK